MYVMSFGGGELLDSILGETHMDCSSTIYSKLYNLIVTGFQKKQWDKAQTTNEAIRWWYEHEVEIRNQGNVPDWKGEPARQGA